MYSNDGIVFWHASMMSKLTFDDEKMLTIDNDIHINEVDINIEIIPAKRCRSKRIILGIARDGFILFWMNVINVCAVDNWRRGALNNTELEKFWNVVKSWEDRDGDDVRGGPPGVRYLAIRNIRIMKLIRDKLKIDWRDWLKSSLDYRESPRQSVTGNLVWTDQTLCSEIVIQ